MRLFVCYFSFVTLCFSTISIAQKSPDKFGDIDIENLKMEKSPIDSTAGAIILFDYGLCTFDHNFEISFERHTRIKIFNSTEFDRGDIKIPHAERDRVERLKASSYNLENGEVIESEVSKKDMFDEEVREGVKQKRFSIPNIKDGSIIEYTYRVNYGGWTSLNPWYFQNTIPSLYSEYVVKLPEYFTYNQLMTGYVSLSDVEKSVENGSYNGARFNLNVSRYTAKNIPAFKDEPYMTTNDNYISKIKYELNRIDVPGSLHKQYMSGNYMSLSKGIAEGDYFGKSLEKNKYLNDVIIETTSGKEADEEKIKALYEYVRDNFEIDYEVAAESLRRILDLKKGYPSDLNRLLTSLLREAGYEASIVRLSTRDHGILHPAYAFSSNFNYTIVCAKNGDQEYLLDASEKELPFNMLPEKCLNGQGLIISETNPRWVSLVPNGSFNRSIYGNLIIDEGGLITGKLNVARKEYGASNFRSDHKNKLDDYKSKFAEQRTNWTLENHEILGFDDLDEPIKEEISMQIEDQVEDLGDIIYLNPLVYGMVDENPFKTEKRLFPVDFGMPVDEVLSYRIKIPEGYKVDEMPQPMAIGLPDKAGSFIYSVQALGEYLSVTSRLNINKTEFSVEEYPYLREFYTQISTKHSEQIVLKKL